jgi:hypothetical protein
VKSQDFEFEKFLISEAIGLTLHGLDFVVGPFQGASGDRVIVIGQETTAMESQGLGEAAGTFPISPDAMVRRWKGWFR